MSKSNRDSGRRERAAAIQAAQARTERNRRIALIGAVVVVLAFIAAAVFWYSGSSKSGTAASGKSYGKVPARVVGLDGAPPKTISTAASTSGSAQALVIGKASAPVKVVVYEDFLCPFCHEFEESSRDFLHAAAAKGKVEVEYRPFHLLQPQYSLDALNAFGAALKSATPTEALRFHDVLYDKQPYENASSFPGADDLASWAKGVGVDGDTVSAAVSADDKTYADAADALATKAKVPGTPTIFVNGKTLAGSSVAQMVENLQTMIGNA